MEEHLVPWPDRARFTRLRFLEDGILRDAEVHLVPPTEPGAPAVLHVWHRAPEDAPPLTFTVEVSEDGKTWVDTSGSHESQAA